MITIPTLTGLYSAVISDLEAEYGSTLPTFGKNFLRALAAVQAGKLYILYRLVAKTQKNIFVDTADSEASGGTLERFGRVKLGRDPFPAQAAQYQVTITGDIGATVPASTTFKSNDSSVNPGKLYILDSAYTLVAATDTIVVRALEAGLDSQLETADEMTSTSPIANVDSIATVSVEIVEPLSAETLEDYREKSELAYRLEAQGGAQSDYVLWGLDAQGVARIYPYAKTGAANEINVFVEATIADSTDGKGTPSPALLSDVEDVIEFDPDTTKTLYERGRRPLGVFAVNVLAITLKQIDIEINGLVGASAADEALISTAITNKINTIRPFIAGADVLENKNDILDVNLIISTILEARPGSVFGTVVLKVDTVSVSTFTFINGDIPDVASISYL